MCSSHKERDHVVIVGAGVAGCHAARNLAVDHEVTVLDRSGIAAEATGLSAGIIAPTLFYSDAPDVARHANDFFREFDDSHGFTFTKRDRIDVMTEAEATEAQELASRLSDEGFPVAYRDSSAVTERYPQFNLAEFAGAVMYEDTGWVDPYTYATALQSAARERGATFELDAEVTDLVSDGGDVSGVETASGTIEADAVVIAAGWRTSSLLPDGVDVQIRPYRTQVVVLEPEEQLSSEFPLGRVGSEHIYFRPEHNGDLLIGGGHYPIDDPASYTTDVDESFRLDIADFVPEFVDGFDDAGFVNGWAGIDTASPDTRPIIDAPRDAPDGLLVAAGFNGLGIMTSPVVGPTVRERLTGESPSFSTDLFAADRFGDVSESFEYVSTSDV
ncbi:FAD-dependent oxidoreductase (plasmid) [Natrialba magadii ATCC 43099]|uniref:FAD-dependent oxidoreductase n=1 Tax=Natrialba magadii (strain ATCC 43099 / DSM 3394 / CCM 3739 / CIP 104546 / IAM 13178 / JCM 8861 / NBRC 102185 / NCIMB 2190 / MS3) TaxID=547559 RepID=D3T1L1_NATMM|nr:FAD-dependent oxidoreductase [Natrialba magadii]ADD07470.1 FAD-dependent oxidoreductase [Natrialba magadii ATCC 43099]ELY32188.1 FAD dependent oxidoreductase [Natrialba magadii ATCC 43099]